jgi:hypothetical protein
LGFTFDDAVGETATSLETMRDLIQTDTKNLDRIFPYIGGEEVNSDPRQKHRRYIIDFGDVSEPDARKWQDLIAIVEEKVKPQRAKVKRKAYRERWWQFAERQNALYSAIRDLSYVFAITQVSPHLAVSMLLLTPLGRTR